jgi:hypothetical protein
MWAVKSEALNTSVLRLVFNRWAGAFVRSACEIDRSAGK